MSTKTVASGHPSALKYTGLLYELMARDIKVKYRSSFLGLLWSLLNPLLTMVVMTLIFSFMFKSEIPNFPIYYMSGVLIFNLNSEATTEAMYSIIGNAQLMKKVYVPKFMFPLSKIFTALVNCGFSMVAMLIIMLVTRTPFHWTLLLIPVLLIMVTMFSTGLGLFLSAIGTRFRDLCYFYNVMMTAWMFFTPIFYPTSNLSPFVLGLMNFNPLYHFVNYSRHIVLYGSVPNLQLHLVCLGMGALALLIGGFTFKKMQRNFIYYV